MELGTGVFSSNIAVLMNNTVIHNKASGGLH